MPSKIGFAVSGLRPCKRYITTHDVNGKSVYADSPEQVFSGPMARSYSINSVPAVLEDERDVKSYKAETGVTSYRTPGIVPPQPGANLVVVDLAPGAESLMHRTVSIDFSICVVGEIDHELDGGEKIRLLPGVCAVLNLETDVMWHLCPIANHANRTTLFSAELCTGGAIRLTNQQDSWLVQFLVLRSILLVSRFGKYICLGGRGQSCSRCGTHAARSSLV